MNNNDDDFFFSEFDPEEVGETKKDRIKSIVSSIICSALLALVCFFTFYFGATSLTGLIIGLAFSILFGILMIVGGFYLFLIPLPFIGIGFVGCIHRNSSLFKNLLLGISCFLSVVFAFVFMFLL